MHLVKYNKMQIIKENSRFVAPTCFGKGLPSMKMELRCRNMQRQYLSYIFFRDGYFIVFY